MNRFFKKPGMNTLVFFLVVLSATFLGLGFKQARVHAVQDPDCGTIVYNRCVNLGYFTNEQRMATGGNPGNQFPWPNWYGYTDANGVGGTWAIPSNIDSNMPSTTAAENFISYTSWALSQPYAGATYCTVWPPPGDTCDVQRRFSTGAAFIIDTMLGRWGTDYGSGDAGITNGLQYARDHFGQWANLVRAYAAAGLVDWNYIELQPPHLNTTSVGYGYSARDVNYFHFLDSEWSSLIRFRSPDGSIYRINRLCLNVSGSANLLPPAIIQGRIFRDDNGNGTREASEPFIQNGVDCTAAPSPRITLGAYITVSGIAGTYPPQYCNNDPYFSVLVETPGNHTVSVVPPAGWQATTNPTTINVQNGQVYNPWFGVRPIPPPVLSCNGFTTSISPPEPGDSFTVTFTISNGAGATSATNAANPLRITIPGTAYNNSVVSYSPDPLVGGGTSSFTTVPISYAAPGTYTISWSLNGSACPTGNITVAAKPYLRIYGGDVQAGMATPTGGSCTSNPNAGIATYNKDSAGAYAGAGVQYMALAPNAIYQFASAALRTTAPTAGYSLSPKNTAPWGGSFGTAGLSCGEDYGKVSGTPAGGSLGAQDFSTNKHKVYAYTGNLYVSDNICFAAGCSNPTYGSIDDIPSFYLIVKGNIYVSKDVRQLDGVYIALPDGSGNNGKIYTCAYAAGSPVPAANIYGDCQTQLTINGAFIANQVKFLRANGTLRASAADRSKDTNIAEIFNYTPELWLSQPNLFPSTTSGYDSITSLPPVL